MKISLVLNSEDLGELVQPQAGSGTSKERDEKQHSRWLHLCGRWSKPVLLGWKEVAYTYIKVWFILLLDSLRL